MYKQDKHNVYIALLSTNLLNTFDSLNTSQYFGKTNKETCINKKLKHYNPSSMCLIPNY